MLVGETGANEQAGYLIERIIDRRDLGRAASTLPN
jgi:hypothetical protein